MAREFDAASTTTCGRCGAEFPGGAMFCTNCGANVVPGRAAGPVIPGYTVLDVLGRGGAAVVYRAHQGILDRHVAIKVLRHDVEDPWVWRDFQREAQTIARLSGHPNILIVYDAGLTDAAEPYLVTEYLDRGSLGDLIRGEGPLPPAEVAAVGLAVADGLLAVHELGIHHRDVKPENVLLGEDGRVKLADFGIARLLAGRVQSTTNVIAFTPEHVAPEILRGEADGPWSDVYGLASTLVTALVGRPLFARRADEPIPALLSRKLAAPAPSLPGTLPQPLASALVAALDPEPARRPSLPEFRSQLAAASESINDTNRLPPPAPGHLPDPLPPRTRVMSPPWAAAAVAGPVGHSSAQKPPTLFDDLKRDRRRRLGIGWMIVGLALVLVPLAILLARRGDEARQTTPSVPPVTQTSAQSAPGVSPSLTSAAPPTTQPSTTAVAVVPPPPSTTGTTSAPPTAPPTTPQTAPPTAVTPTTIPVAEPPAQQDVPGVFAPDEAEAFLRSYFDSVGAGNYETSWSQLTSDFQRGKARSFEYYVDFWNKNDIEVGEVSLVDADDDTAVLHAELRWNGAPSTVIDQFTLVRGARGELLIAKQETVEG